MIRQLPEGSRFSAAMKVDRAAEIKEIEISDRDKAISDARNWTFDRELAAMVINAVNTNTVLSQQWEKGKEPSFPTVGPDSWQPKEKVSEEPKDLTDVLKRMGWPGGN